MMVFSASLTQGYENHVLGWFFLQMLSLAAERHELVAAAWPDEHYISSR